MKKNTRKSTALVSLVLVPLNLMGLGFVGGCDGGDDSNSRSYSRSASSAGGGGESADFDYRDPNDPFDLDPVAGYAGGAPATQPTTRPLASSAFAHAGPYHSGTYTHYRSGRGGVHPRPDPVPPGVPAAEPADVPLADVPLDRVAGFDGVPARVFGAIGVVLVVVVVVVIVLAHVPVVGRQPRGVRLVGAFGVVIVVIVSARDAAPRGRARESFPAGAGGAARLVP